MYLYPKGYDETSEGQIHKQIKIHAKKKRILLNFILYVVQVSK